MILRKLMSTLTLNKLKKRTFTEKVGRPKKKLDRFDGLSEEEVQKYTLPDYLEMNLDMVFVGINPSLMAAHRGRYYAGPGNHFYKLLHESGLTPRCLKYEEDYKLCRYGIGLTNIVSRATRSSADLKRTEIKEGCETVKEKLKQYKPKIAVFNGKCIYDVFSNKTNDFHFGLQPERIEDVALWVTPSSSARCANFPKMTDKLHFFTALKKYLQFLKGEIQNVDTSEFLFEGKCKQFIPRTSKMWRRKNVSAFLYGGRIANKDTVCLDTSDENVAVACSTEFIVKHVQIDKNSEIKEMLDTDRTEPSKNSEAIIAEGRVKTFFESDTSFQKEESNFLHNEINNVKKPSSKKLSQQTDKLQNFVRKKGSASDFISLIKQRLEEKEHNNFDDKNNSKKLVKPSSSN
ncbi:G/T mismatch-specific thymine DNA glycosylase [Nomia melanderi]|uniref:G/T mismatch-specific thymine DNA glycosylase n=1 Tax=Nomia melanderi TaxID=2448451 RepID=UPI00130400D3|nr:G/T mismatch-specific thymine DNA glycosylase-like [Nomia melanderi]